MPNLLVHGQHSVVCRIQWVFTKDWMNLHLLSVPCFHIGMAEPTHSPDYHRTGLGGEFLGTIQGGWSVCRGMWVGGWDNIKEMKWFMLNCDCRGIKYNQRETRSAHCKGNHPTLSAALQATQLPPLLMRPTQLFPKEPSEAVKCMDSSQTTSFPWQLSCSHLLWEEERWVSVVFSGHMSTLWWPDSALLQAFLQRGALVFLSFTFLGNTQISETPRDTQSFNSLPPRDLYQSEEACVPRVNGELRFWRPAHGLDFTDMKRKEGARRRKGGNKEERRQGGKDCS